MSATQPASIVASCQRTRPLTGIHGIDRGRIRDTLDKGIACVEVRATAGERETIQATPVVLDGDILEVARERVRLIGLNAPEGGQTCVAQGWDWPYGKATTTVVHEMVGGQPVVRRVFGCDRP